MVSHPLNPLSILGLVASDASFYLPGTRRVGDRLRSLPDSVPADEHGTAQSLWLFD
jgi:hypothetical protein